MMCTCMRIVQSTDMNTNMGIHKPTPAPSGDRILARPVLGKESVAHMYDAMYIALLMHAR